MGVAFCESEMTDANRGQDACGHHHRYQDVAIADDCAMHPAKSVFCHVDDMPELFPFVHNVTINSSFCIGLQVLLVTLT